MKFFIWITLIRRIIELGILFCLCIEIMHLIVKANSFEQNDSFKTIIKQKIWTFTQNYQFCIFDIPFVSCYCPSNLKSKQNCVKVKCQYLKYHKQILFDIFFRNTKTLRLFDVVLDWVFQRMSITIFFSRRTKIENLFFHYFMVWIF